MFENSTKEPEQISKGSRGGSGSIVRVPVWDLIWDATLIWDKMGTYHWSDMTDAPVNPDMATNGSAVVPLPISQSGAITWLLLRLQQWLTFYLFRQTLACSDGYSAAAASTIGRCTSIRRRNHSRGCFWAYQSLGRHQNSAKPECMH